MKETELAGRIVSYLEESDWKVYQEVACRGFVCDIVATRGALVYTVECKTTLSLAVMSQACRWLPYCNYSSVAVPTGKQTPSRRFALKTLRRFGIGCLTVSYESIRYEEHPQFNRRRLSALKTSLRDEQRTYAKAGSPNGGHYTPFKATCHAVRQAVKLQPGIDLKQLVARVDHHYRSDATAKQCLRRWIENGTIDGIETRMDGRKRTYHPC